MLCKITKLHHNFRKLYNELDGLLFFRLDLNLGNSPALNPEWQSWLWKFVQKYSDNGLIIYTTANLPNGNMYHQILGSSRRNVQVQTRCTLSDLLAMRCTNVLLCTPIYPEEFNLFLKHWIKGANEVVETLYVEIEYVNEFTDLIFRDIKCWNTPKQAAKRRRRIKIRKDIYSCAGVRATLAISRWSVEMCVWK